MPKLTDTKNHGRAAVTGASYFRLHGGETKTEKPKRRNAMITQMELLCVLERLAPWHHRATDWRKLPNGKVARFVDWGWKKRKGVRA